MICIDKHKRNMAIINLIVSYNVNRPYFELPFYKNIVGIVI